MNKLRFCVNLVYIIPMKVQCMQCNTYLVYIYIIPKCNTYDPSVRYSKQLRSIKLKVASAAFVAKEAR